MIAGMLDQSSLAHIAVLRILCAGNAGCTTTDIKKDLQSFVSHRLSQGEWRRILNEILILLVRDNLIEQISRERYMASSAGGEKALNYLGVSKMPTKDWKDLKSLYLVAKAIGIKSRTPRTLRPLKVAEGLRSAIVKNYFDLQIRAEIPATSQVRNALAIHTIGKTFNAPKDQRFSAKSQVPKKLALFLASRNLHRPRDIESSGQLLTLLAAEAVGAVQSDPNSLRQALLRKLVTRTEDEALQKVAEKAMNNEINNPAISKETLDLEGFAGIVQQLAQTSAKGWSGNRRAYISHVWHSMKTEKPDLNLDEDSFKSMLTEAHRAGHITLAIADLRDKANMADIQNSVTRYKNTEWHFIRVED